MSHFTISSMSGASGITNITVSAPQNNFNSSVVEDYTLSNSTKSVMMPITQKPAPSQNYYINISPSSITFTAKGGRSSITVNSNDKWSLKSSEWIDIANSIFEAKTSDVSIKDSKFEEQKYISMNGSGNTVIGISVKANSGPYRSGGITATCVSDLSVFFVASINQIGGFVEPYINPIETQLKFDASGTSGYELRIDSNVSWTASTDSKWIILTNTSGASGDSLFFDIDENTDKIDRKGVILLENVENGIKAEVFVLQKAVEVEDDYIYITPSYHYSQSSGDSFTISVSSNTSWSTSFDVDWIKLDKLNGEYNDVVTVTIAQSTAKATRDAYISFNTTGLKVDCHIVQDAPAFVPELSVNPWQLNFSAMDEKYKTTYVTSNVDWVAHSNQEWCRIDTSSGSGDGSIDVVVDSNSGSERTAIIYVTAVSYSLATAVSVHQDERPPYIMVSPVEKYVASSGETYSLNVYSNILWSVEADEPFISLGSNTGSGNGLVQITVSPFFYESEMEQRKGNVTVYNSKSGISSTHSIIQLT